MHALKFKKKRIHSRIHARPAAILPRNDSKEIRLNPKPYLPLPLQLGSKLLRGSRQS